MIIKGFQKFSLLDYPGKLSCILFVANCNFRCGFCHNRDLVLNSPELPQISREEILAFLDKRKGQLDGVVITGGEPTLYSELTGLIGQIRQRGYLVKLDTNGSNPGVIEDLIGNKLVDYWAMDVKGTLDEDYFKIVNCQLSIADIKKSIELILNSGVDFEFRTTVVPGIHGKDNLVQLAKSLKQLTINNQQLDGCHWYLQQFLPKNCLDLEFAKVKPFSYKEMEEMLKGVKKIIPNVFLRGLSQS